jgi:Kef-type K+ transport system membrane component KefB
MRLESVEVARLLIVLAVIVFAAHALAALFLRFRQPPVIGEIVAGLILGPTVLGLVAAPVAAAFLPAAGVTPTVLGALSQLGLLLLMFTTGGELLIRPAPGERRMVSTIAVAGMVVPFLCAIAVVPLLNYRDFSGEAGTAVTFALIFGIAIAVTSIPVISRIMMDLGILRTTFARVVLSVAALEDVVLYVVLAITLSLGQAHGGDRYGLWAMLHIDSITWSAIYHTTVTVALFACFLGWGGRAIRRLVHSPAGFLDRRNPVAFRLVLLLTSVLLFVLLGVNPIFGAFLAGVAIRRSIVPNRLPRRRPSRRRPSPQWPPYGRPSGLVGIRATIRARTQIRISVATRTWTGRIRPGRRFTGSPWRSSSRSISSWSASNWT